MISGRFCGQQEIVGVASGRFPNVLGTNIIVNGGMAPTL